jgi:hypothetical protein
MKKIILFFLLLSGGILSAQNDWCPAGATWYYGSYCGPPLADAKVKVTYIKDTLFQSVVCKYTKKELTCGPPWGGLSGIGHDFSYENNGVVYLYNANGAFDTLFDFHATIGDKWLRYIALSGTEGDTNTCNFNRSFVTVLDTGHAQINGSALKKLVLQYDIVYSEANSLAGSFVDTVYEKLGSVLHGWNPIICESYYGMTDIGDYSSFRCYEDSAFGLYHKPGTLNCDSIRGVGLAEAAIEKQWKLFPNPSTGELTLDLSGLASLPLYAEIYNAAGTCIRRLEKPELNGPVIDLKDRAKGIYLLRIHTASGTVSRKFVLQ